MIPEATKYIVTRDPEGRLLSVRAVTDTGEIELPCKGMHAQVSWDGTEVGLAIPGKLVEFETEPE